MTSLSELKRFLSQRGTVPLRDIAHHFDTDPAVIRDMLEHWVRKGKVEVTIARSACQSHCGGCGSGPTNLYHWRETSPGSIGAAAGAGVTIASERGSLP